MSSNSLAHQLEQESIQNKVPFEHESNSIKLIYAEEVDKLVAGIESNDPSELDSRIIDEVLWENKKVNIELQNKILPWSKRDISIILNK